MTTTTDYLMKGCGLMGLGFADTLVRETDAHVTLVDERAAPGGHWGSTGPALGAAGTGPKHIAGPSRSPYVRLASQGGPFRPCACRVFSCPR